MNLTQQTRICSFAMLLALSLAFHPASPGLAAQEADSVISKESDSATVATLLEQLDSSSFKDREAATEALVQLGPEILKPLSAHFFNSSSEAGWRIHRVLEGIGKHGKRADFLKSIAIIQLLYGAQDKQSQQRLAELQYQWKNTQRTEAAAKLKQQGFQFQAQARNANHEVAMERARIEMLVRAAAVRELGGIEIATAPKYLEKNLPQKEKPLARWENPRDNRQKSIAKIEEIIANSEEENRKFVGSHLPPSLVALPPGALAFPDNWQVSDESLKLIEDLSPLTHLSFRGQRIDEGLQKFIASQTMLTSVSLTDCEFTQGEDLSVPSSVKQLTFDGTEPPPEFFSSLRQISTLKLKSLALDETLAGAIGRCKVQMIELEEVEFNRQSIRKLIGMRGLFRASMSLCKFELQWLEDIRRRNPNLVTASPKAFLGVQGPMNDAGRKVKGCQISHVVPDTAAAKGGMQSMDIVTAMDGEKISRFEDLRLLISQKRPGESMKLEVQRGDKTVELEVKLGNMSQPVR